MADALGVKTQASWSASGTLEAITSKTAMVSDAQGMSGYRVSDGSKVWSNAFENPPADAKITDPQHQKTTVLGSSVLVAWGGKGPDAGLEPSKNISVVALYDIDTGKQIGKTQTFEQQWDLPRLQDAGVHASTMTYLLPWEDTIYPDGTVRHVKSPSNADDLLGEVHTSLVSVAKDRMLLAGTSNGTDKTVIALTNDSSRVGSTLTCAMDQPTGRVQDESQDHSDFMHSPNQQWAVWGKALVNLKTGENRCLSGLSSASVDPVAVSDAGDVWGVANKKGFVLKHGAAQPTIVPGLPVAVLPGGIIAKDSDHISMFSSK